MNHPEPHPLAGQTVRIKEGVEHPQFRIGGAEYRVEDWWDRVAGKSWMVCQGNPACLIYAMRSGFARIPTDNEVLYGKVNGLGVLVHKSEIEMEENNG